MPGIATRLTVAEKVFDALGGVSNGVALDKAWFMFGAVGPAIGDFVPIGNIPGTGGQTTASPYLSFWQQVLVLAMGTTAAPGLIPTLQQLQSLLTNLQSLIDNQDFNGLEDLKNSGALTNLPTLVQQLTTSIGVFQDPAQLQALGNLIGLGPQVNSTAFQALPTSWTGREWLHWKKPGVFADKLLSHATAANDARFVSYALGWRVAYATLVCGSGFVNSIVGSNYRTYWWRNRWISNFVDAWVWGFYKSGASLGDDGNPTTSPTEWGYSLCNAQLHQAIDVTGGALDGPTAASAVVQNVNSGTPLFTGGASGGLLAPPLPTDFADFWMSAWNDAYNSSTVFKPEALQTGYLMMWLMLWFQTSGQVIGCLSTTAPQPPDASCDSSTYATQQAASTPGQGSPTDLEPTPEHDPRTGETVCGVILAILGVVATYFVPPLGAAAVAGGVALAVDGEEQLNWQQLQCQMFWIQTFMFNALWDLHKVAVLAGLQHPFASDLDISSATTISFGPTQLSYLSSAATCQGRALRAMLQPWNANLFSVGPTLTATWTDYPTGAPVETKVPNTPAWEVLTYQNKPYQVQWPSAIVDDAVRNPQNISITDGPVGFDSGFPPASSDVPASFGPALQSALSILNAPATQLPDWNLDDDRSLGWLSWQFQNYGPYSVPVKTEIES
ncbi:hypothetical protein [Bradyrhizobium sp.]